MDLGCPCILLVIVGNENDFCLGKESFKCCYDIYVWVLFRVLLHQ